MTQEDKMSLLFSRTQRPSQAIKTYSKNCSNFFCWLMKHKKKKKSRQLHFPGLLKFHKSSNGIKNFMFGKNLIIQTIYFFWFLHESFLGHTWKRYNLRKHLVRSCVSKKNIITPGSNHNGLIHVFFISCKWHSSKSVISRHMAAQKLTQYMRGIWASGQSGPHLVHLWVWFLQYALSLGTSFTAHFLQSNGLGAGKYPRHTKHF